MKTTSFTKLSALVIAAFLGYLEISHAQSGDAPNLTPKVAETQRPEQSADAPAGFGTLQSAPIVGRLVADTDDGIVTLPAEVLGVGDVIAEIEDHIGDWKNPRERRQAA